MSDLYSDFNYPGSELHSQRAREKAGRTSLSKAEPIVKASDIAYILFNKTDLQLQKAFLVDFGFQVAQETPDALYMRGTGALPYFYVAHKNTQLNGFSARATASTAKQNCTVSAKFVRSPSAPLMALAVAKESACTIRTASL